MVRMMRSQPGEPRAGHTGNAIASIVGIVMGTQPAVVMNIEDRAEQLREVAAILRRHGGAASLHVADAIEHWLANGGDLNKLLGVKVRRGRACDVPSTRLLKQRRDDEIRKVAQTIGGRQAAKIRELQDMLSRRDQRVLIIHEGIKRVPGSAAQLALILKGGC
jgi:hypothetical protein